MKRGPSLDDLVRGDRFAALCGEHIADGYERRVYAHMHDPNLVVKVERRPQLFANVAEWQLYDEVRRVVPGMLKWLAAVVDISNSGAILIQERTQPVTLDECPKKVPEWMSDLKVKNFGRTNDGRIVSHDSSMHAAWVKGLSNRLVTARYVP